MDGAEITQLYQRFGPVVYRRCLRVLGNKEDARDATQQVFIKLIKEPRRFADLDEALPWMQSVASNYCFNLLRDSKRRGAKLDGFAHVDSHHEGPDGALERQQIARQVLARGDDLDRSIAQGVLIAGKEQQEVAAELGVSEKTVQRRLKSFLENARRFLQGKDE